MASKHITVTLRLPNTETHSRRSFTLSQDNKTITIGRASKSQTKNFVPAEDNAWFDSRVMSRNHALLGINPSEEVVWIQDVGSMHGTCLNGTKIPAAAEVPMKTGDQITLGAEVSRGTDTFTPLRLYCDYQWVEGPPATAPTAPKPMNHFSVPDNEDDEDDIMIETVSQLHKSREVVVLSDSEDMNKSDSHSVKSVKVSSPTTSLVSKPEIIKDDLPSLEDAVPEPDQNPNNTEDLGRYLDFDSEDQQSDGDSGEDDREQDGDGDDGDDDDDEYEEEDDRFLDEDNRFLDEDNRFLDDDDDDDDDDEDSEERENEVGDRGDGVANHYMSGPKELEASTSQLPGLQPPISSASSVGNDKAAKMNTPARDATLNFSTPAFNVTGFADLPLSSTYPMLPTAAHGRDHRDPSTIISAVMEPPIHPTSLSAQERWTAESSTSVDSLGLIDHSLHWCSHNNTTYSSTSFLNKEPSSRAAFCDFLPPGGPALAPPRHSIDNLSSPSRAPFVPPPTSGPVERNNELTPRTVISPYQQYDTEGGPIAYNPSPSTRVVSISDILDQVPPKPEDSNALKRKAYHVADDITQSSINSSVSTKGPSSTEGHNDPDFEDDGTSFPDAQPQAPLLDEIISTSQTSNLSVAEGSQLRNESTPERPRKRVRTEARRSGSNFLRFATTALVGAVAGGLATVAALASLPPDYFG